MNNAAADITCKNSINLIFNIIIHIFDSVQQASVFNFNLN